MIETMKPWCRWCGVELGRAPLGRIVPVVCTDCLRDQNMDYMADRIGLKRG